MITPIYKSDVLTVLNCSEHPRHYKEMPEDGHWQRADWAWAHNGVGPRTTARRLEEFSDTFNFAVMMHADQGPPPRFANGAITEAQTSRHWVSREDRINVILTNNVATLSNHVALTPWMMFHRTGHCCSLGNDAKEIHRKHPLANLGSIIPGHQTRGHPFDILGWEPSQDLDALLRLILGGRAARKGLLSSSADFMCEIFAQHHLGGIKFNHTSGWEERSEILKNKLSRAPLQIEAIKKMFNDPDWTDHMLDELADSLGHQIEAMKKDMVGKTFMF